MKVQYDERSEEHLKDFNSLQEKIIIMADNVEEVQRRLENLLLVEDKD